MNTPKTSMPRWLKALLWLTGLFVLGFVLTGVWVYQSLRLNAEARSLKSAVVSSLGQPVHAKVQLSVGSVLLGVARQTVAFVPDAPPEAAAALRAVKSASVGVFELERVGQASASALTASDSVMARRGWHRVVGVRDSGTLVMVYTPSEDVRAGDVRVCVAVVDGKNLVVVSGRIDARELLPLINEQLDKQLAMR